ncbi:hypothetical protein SDC9_68892 [bioreactor metagenome]|uniref:Ribbon-helix-helix protein CopG domain-containing protein n=1 Tax=bioreactor metagenome TaxID=1076179 RepID=A0A644Y2Q8_9ZZZZ
MTEIQDFKNVTTVRLNTALNSRRVRFPHGLSTKVSTYAKQGLCIAAEEQGLTPSELTRDIIDNYLEEYFRNRKI